MTRNDMTAVESRFIGGPVGRLDSRWHGPVGGAPVLVLHPHPQYGGTMGSRLVYDLAVALAEAGHRVVRFDYRGVGRSEGHYDHGDGETDDAVRVWQALRGESGLAPAVVGYSFGGGVATRLAAREPVPRLALIGTQPRVYESTLAPTDDAAHVRAQTHLFVGPRDEFVTVEQTQALARRFQPPAQVTVIPGAGHFLEPSHNPAVVAAVRAFLA